MNDSSLKKIKSVVLGLLRLSFGWIFFWAFIDKLFGLQFATETGWLDGASPTSGFLEFGTKGPLAEFYQGLAGNIVVDWLFMLGLAFEGLTLLLGIGVRLGSATGLVLMLLIYGAVFPPANNPFMDEHLVYGLLFFALTLSDAGQHLGLGKMWLRVPFVKKYPFLQ